MFGLEWYPCCRLRHNCFGVSVWLDWSGIRVAGLGTTVLVFRGGWVGVVSVLQAEAQLVFYSSTIIMMHGPINIRTTRKPAVTSGSSIILF